MPKLLEGKDLGFYSPSSSAVPQSHCVISQHLKRANRNFRSITSESYYVKCVPTKQRLINVTQTRCICSVRHKHAVNKMKARCVRLLIVSVWFKMVILHLVHVWDCSVCVCIWCDGICMCIDCVCSLKKKKSYCVFMPTALFCVLGVVALMCICNLMYYLCFIFSYCLYVGYILCCPGTADEN